MSRARPKVGKLDVAVLEIKDHVLGLDVAMDQAALLGVFERLGHRHHDPKRGLLLDDLVFIERVFDRGPFNVFHHEEVMAIHLAGIDRVDDIVVRELGGDLGLAVEPLDELFILGERIEQDLHGDDPIDARLPRLEHHPHRALAEPLDNRVAGDFKLLVRLAHLLQEPLRLGLGEHLGLDHDIEQSPGFVTFCSELGPVRLAHVDLDGSRQPAPQDGLLEIELAQARQGL